MAKKLFMYLTEQLVSQNGQQNEQSSALHCGSFGSIAEGKIEDIRSTATVQFAT